MQSEENCPRMCQGLKEGEKGGPGKADRQEVARVAERKPKGNEFLGGYGKMSQRQVRATLQCPQEQVG